MSDNRTGSPWDTPLTRAGRITNVKTRGCGLWPGVTQGTGRPARSAGSSRLRVRHPPQAQLCPRGGLHRPGQQHWHSRALASAQGGAWASRSCAHGAASHLGEGGRLHRDHAPRPRKRLRANPTCPASSVERQQVTARRERRPMGSRSPRGHRGLGKRWPLREGLKAFTGSFRRRV